MTNIMVGKNTVKDYSAWRTGFDNNAPMQAEYGMHIKVFINQRKTPTRFS